MSLSNENDPISVVIPVGSLSTDGTLIPAMYLPKKAKIVSAYVLNGAAIAADNTNYATLTLKSGSTVVASLDTRAANQGALAANVGSPMAIVSGQEARASGESLSLLYNEGGTMALTNAILVLTYFPI